MHIPIHPFNNNFLVVGDIAVCDRYLFYLDCYRRVHSSVQRKILLLSTKNLVGGDFRWAILVMQTSFIFSFFFFFFLSDPPN